MGSATRRWNLKNPVGNQVSWAWWLGFMFFFAAILLFVMSRA